MQIKVFLFGEEDTNGMYDLLPRFFLTCFQTRKLPAPPPPPLLEEFWPHRFYLMSQLCFHTPPQENKAKTIVRLEYLWVLSNVTPATSHKTMARKPPQTRPSPVYTQLEHLFEIPELLFHLSGACIMLSNGRQTLRNPWNQGCMLNKAFHR